MAVAGTPDSTVCNVLHRVGGEHGRQRCLRLALRRQRHGRQRLRVGRRLGRGVRRLGRTRSAMTPRDSATPATGPRCALLTVAAASATARVLGRSRSSAVSRAGSSPQGLRVPWRPLVVLRRNTADTRRIRSSPTSTSRSWLYADSAPRPRPRGPAPPDSWSARRRSGGRSSGHWACSRRSDGCWPAPSRSASRRCSGGAPSRSTGRRGRSGR